MRNKKAGGKTCDRFNKLKTFYEAKIMNKSDYSILGAAFLSFLFSIALWFGLLGTDPEVNKQSGIFVGLWVPSIIGLGIYVKTAKRGIA